MKEKKTNTGYGTQRPCLICCIWYNLQPNLNELPVSNSPRKRAASSGAAAPPEPKKPKTVVEIDNSKWMCSQKYLCVAIPIKTNFHKGIILAFSIARVIFNLYLPS